MIQLGFFYSPDVFELLPSISIMALRCCDTCKITHGLELQIQWLWWGTVLSFLRPETE